MKKLFKQEWKFYLVASLLLGVVLIGYNLFEGYLFYYWRMTDIAWEIPGLMKEMCCVPMANIWITAAAYIIIKFYRYWRERNGYGREFLVMLPIKTREREIFYILADVGFISIPNIVYWILVWRYGVSVLSDADIEIPWLLSAILPLVVVEIAYLLMLFAVSRFIESLIVNGVWKIIGAIAAVALLFGSLYMSEDIFSVGGKTEEIYYFLQDFVSLDGRNFYGNGNRDYESEWEEYTRYMEEIGSKFFASEEINKVTDLYNGEWSSGLEVLYNGEPIEKTFLMVEAKGTEEAEKSEYQMKLRQAAFDWASYDFEMKQFGEYGTIPESYIVWANLVFSLFLIILTVYLAGKREYSKSMFYFNFAKYIFAVLIGCIVIAVGFAVGEGNGQTIWQRLLIVFSAICLAGLCSYYLTPEHNAKL